MAGSNDHEVKRKVLNRPKKWTHDDDFHVWNPTVCQHLLNSDPQAMRMTYIECLRMQEQIRQWEELERRKTATSARRAPPHYYESDTVPPLPPPDVVGWAQSPESSSNVFNLPAMFMTLLPVLTIWMLGVLCLVILECRRERKLASVQRRPQDLQTTPLLPGGTMDDWLPPYSECEHSGTNKNEELPPPPYSACFLKPEEAELVVHSRTQNVLDERAQSSTDIGNENGLRAKSLATSSNQSGDVAPGSKTEVVLDTNRIV